MMDEVTVLRSPRAGIPAVVSTRPQLEETISALAAGSGPVAIDTERAQSYRYSGRAYLLQLRRAGAGTHLVDPVALSDDLPRLAQVVDSLEWVLHAASQDLPCLIDAGFSPSMLFDTELGGRLLGFDKVGLGALIERAFSIRLLKKFSAVNWSKRPLPSDWLAYAALDVELLLELREWTSDRLQSAGKDVWAAQEFAHLVAHAHDVHPPVTDPWRHTTGLNEVRTRAGLAVVRELWLSRDEIARHHDLAPGRILPDRAICDIAAGISTRLPISRSDMREIPAFQSGDALRFAETWLAALARAAGLPRQQYPPLRAPLAAIPHPRTWVRDHPEAFTRWQAIRPLTLEIAQQLEVPVENLISPWTVRQLAWEPPVELTRTSIDVFLSAARARPWQREILVSPLAESLSQLS